MAVPSPVRRRGFLASGGWVLLLALGLVSAVMITHVVGALRHQGRAIGDGRDPSTYGYALQPSLVPREAIVAGGMPKDGLPALVDPPAWSLAELDAAAARQRRRKILVADDRVIGVRSGGQARAYPLRVLVWHEVANDALGGVPILVAYHPLSDAAVVARRPRDTTFGVSGLLLDSTQVVYERSTAGRGESLWAPLALRAVTGPSAAAGAVLEPIPCAVTTWRAWREAHPETTVLAPDPRLGKEYGRDPYVSYLGNDELRFPVRREFPAAWCPRKTPVLAVRCDGRWVALPYPVAASRVDRDGIATIEVGGRTRRVRVGLKPPTLALEDGGEPLPSVQAFAFAWYALHPDDTVWVR
jgi:hypothetical protein